MARTAKRLGAEPVIVYRRSRAQMPAHDFEIDEALEEGVVVNWLRTIGAKGHQRRPTILQVNNIYGLLLAIESGLGIGALPDYMVGRNNNLQRILPDVHGPVFDTFFVYPEELRKSKRITIFREFLEEKAREWQF